MPRKLPKVEVVTVKEGTRTVIVSMHVVLETVATTMTTEAMPTSITAHMPTTHPPHSGYRGRGGGHGGCGGYGGRRGYGHQDYDRDSSSARRANASMMNGGRGSGANRY